MSFKARIADIQIYQVADVDIYHAMVNEKDAVLDRHKTKTKSKATDMLLSGYSAFPSRMYGAARGEITLEGFLLSIPTQTSQAALQRLTSLVGVIIPIIGFVQMGGPRECIGCPAPTIDPCELVWVTAAGVIVEVDPLQKKLASQPSTLKVDILLMSSWSPLEPPLWTFGEGIHTPAYYAQPVTTFSAEAIRYPDCEQTFNTCCGKWVYTQYADNDDWLYNPDYWAIYANDIGDPNDSTLRAGIGSHFTALPMTTRIDADPSRWGHRTRSIYALTNLPTAGGIYIVAQTTADGWSHVQYQTTIDLEALHAQIIAAGYDGLALTDVLYLGEFRRYVNGSIYAPAFVVREGDVMQHVYPTIHYESDYPGGVGAGHATVRINATADALAIATPQVAYHHLYRRI